MCNTIRKITDEELADLPEKWVNSNIDTRKYIPCALEAYEVDQDFYAKWVAEGNMGEIVNGRYYVA